jgi:hypothetical protein
MDALLALYFRMTSLPFDLWAGWLDTLESDRLRYERYERPAANIEREEEIERLELRLAEIRRQ